MSEETWIDSDVMALRQYVLTHPRFIDELKRRAVKISITSISEAALTGARHAGAESTISDILSMCGDINQNREKPQFIDPTKE